MEWQKNALNSVLICQYIATLNNDREKEIIIQHRLLRVRQNTRPHSFISLLSMIKWIKLPATVSIVWCLLKILPVRHFSLSVIQIGFVAFYAPCSMLLVVGNRAIYKWLLCCSWALRCAATAANRDLHITIFFMFFNLLFPMSDLLIRRESCFAGSNDASIWWFSCLLHVYFSSL